MSEPPPPPPFPPSPSVGINDDDDVDAVAAGTGAGTATGAGAATLLWGDNDNSGAEARWWRSVGPADPAAKNVFSSQNSPASAGLSSIGNDSRRKWCCAAAVVRPTAGLAKSPWAEPPFNRPSSTHSGVPCGVSRDLCLQKHVRVRHAGFCMNGHQNKEQQKHNVPSRPPTL